MKDKVVFETNVPVEVSLARAEGRKWKVAGARKSCTTWRMDV